MVIKKTYRRVFVHNELIDFAVLCFNLFLDVLFQVEVPVWFRLAVVQRAISFYRVQSPPIHSRSGIKHVAQLNVLRLLSRNMRSHTDGIHQCQPERIRRAQM